jgi:hypothetical protein
MTAQPTFENTWPKAPFAELIRLALSLTETLMKRRTRLTASAPVQHA